MGGSHIAVIGCGLIGESWSALMSAYGHDVVAWDPSAPDARRFFDRVDAAKEQLRRIDPTGTSRHGRLNLAATLEEALAGARWVQENAPESASLKAELYGNIEQTLDDNAVIASSTSSLTWSELSAGLKHPGRFITAHPFNPPHLMPLVEIYASDEQTRDRAVAFYRSLGREPVTLARDAAGHIANRLASALWREAVNIVAEGIADVASVDKALVHGPGLRWSIVGAHMAYHLGGGAGGIEAYLKHLGPSQERRWATLGTPRLTPEVCALLVEGVRQEAAGRPVPSLETLRDEALIRVLSARRETADVVN